MHASVRLLTLVPFRRCLQIPIPVKSHGFRCQSKQQCDSNRWMQTRPHSWSRIKRWRLVSSQSSACMPGSDTYLPVYPTDLLDKIKGGVYSPRHGINRATSSCIHSFIPSKTRYSSKKCYATTLQVCMGSTDCSGLKRSKEKAKLRNKSVYGVKSERVGDRKLESACLSPKTLNCPVEALQSKP